MPQVSVVILSYNNYVDTVNCVNSIISNSFKQIVIYIIDNHSPDGSFNILQKELSNIPHIFLWETTTNLGFAGGLNFGAKKVQENGPDDYLLFLNNDTILDKNCIFELVVQAKNLGDKNIYLPISYFSKLDLVSCGGMISYIPSLFQFRYQGWRTVPHKYPYISPYLSGACFLMHQSLFFAVGGFDEKFFLYGEDILFGERARQFGGNIYMIPTAKIWHHGSKSAGYVSLTKAYYLSRNLPYLVEEISNNNLSHRLNTYLYLFSQAILALLSFRLKNIQTIFKGFHDYQNGVWGKWKDSSM
jgi:hypothetical protein